MARTSGWPEYCWPYVSTERRIALRESAPRGLWPIKSSAPAATPRPVPPQLPSLMKLPAAHEPPRNIGGLQRRTLGRRMGGKIAGDRDQNVPALGAVAPLRELAPARFEHLIGVKARVLPQHRAPQSRDERLRRGAAPRVGGHPAAREPPHPLLGGGRH